MKLQQVDEAHIDKTHMRKSLHAMFESPLEARKKVDAVSTRYQRVKLSRPWDGR